MTPLRPSDRRTPGHRRRLASLALAVVCWAAGTAYAAEPCVWSCEVTGEGTPENINAEEARQAARTAARLKAVEQVVGVELHSQSLVRDHMNAAHFLLTFVHGQVVKERNVRWEQVALQQSPPVTMYRVRLEACVAPNVGRRDPYFSVHADLNKATFVSGERAAIRVRCSKDCHLSILNLIGKDEFSLLLPNEHQKTAALPAGAEMSFPPQGRGLEIETLPGHSRNSEAFLIVATKQPLPGLHGVFRDRERVPFTEVAQALQRLPASERAEALLVYEVWKK